MYEVTYPDQAAVTSTRMELRGGVLRVALQIQEQRAQQDKIAVDTADVIDSYKRLISEVESGLNLDFADAPDKGSGKKKS